MIGAMKGWGPEQFWEAYCTAGDFGSPGDPKKLLEVIGHCGRKKGVEGHSPLTRRTKAEEFQPWDKSLKIGAGDLDEMGAAADAGDAPGEPAPTSPAAPSPPGNGRHPEIVPAPPAMGSATIVALRDTDFVEPQPISAPPKTPIQLRTKAQALLEWYRSEKHFTGDPTEFVNHCIERYMWWAWRARPRVVVEEQDDDVVEVIAG